MRTDDEINAVFREAIALATAAELRGAKGVRLLLNSSSVGKDHLILALAGMSCRMARQIGRTRPDGKLISARDVLMWVGRAFAEQHAPDECERSPELDWWDDDES